MHIKMDTKKEIVGDVLYLKKWKSNKYNVYFNFQMKKNLGSKNMAICFRRKEVDSRAKIDPPKEKCHLMTHVSFVKNMVSGRVSVNSNKHSKKWKH